MHPYRLYDIFAVGVINASLSPLEDFPLMQIQSTRHVQPYP